MVPLPPPPPAIVYEWAPKPVPVAVADFCRLTLGLPLDGLDDSEMHDFKSCVVVSLWRLP
jgi:hypothetical protein